MTYRAQQFDLLQLMFEQLRLNDTRLHAVLRFAPTDRLDADLLARAVRLTLDAAPILATRFVPRDGHSHWTPLPSDRLGEAFAVVPDEDALQACLLVRVNGPQVRVLLTADGTGLAVVLSHHVADGASFKEYLYLLAECYTGLASDPGFRPEPMDDDRSVRGLTSSFSLRERLTSLASDPPTARGGLVLPLSGEDTTPFLIALETGPVGDLRARSHAVGATLNDAILAAFYRVLTEQLGDAAAAGIDLPMMVDLRRYLGPDTPTRMLTNCSSTTNTRLAVVPGEPFQATLARTAAMTRALKDGDIGRKGAVQLAGAYTFGRRLGYALVRSRLRWPRLAITNIGSLDPDRLRFGSASPAHAWASGSIKHQPNFQVSVSSYRDRLTLTVGLFGNADDRVRSEQVLAAIAAELDACGRGGAQLRRTSDRVVTGTPASA